MFSPRIYQGRWGFDITCMDIWEFLILHQQSSIVVSTRHMQPSRVAKMRSVATLAIALGRLPERDRLRALNRGGILLVEGSNRAELRLVVLEPEAVRRLPPPAPDKDKDEPKEKKKSRFSMFRRKCCDHRR